MTRFSLFIILCFLTTVSFGQRIHNFKIPDSLIDKSYKELIDLFIKHPLKDTINKEIYSNTLLLKAKKEENKLEMARAYRFNSFIYYKNLPIRIAYLDSSITVSKDLNDIKYPMVSYSNLGVLYSNMGEYTKSMEAYLNGLEYSKKNKNIDFIHIIKHNIARLKSKIGEDKEAIKIFKSVLDYENSSNVNSRSRVNTLLSLANSYRKLKQNDTASYYNKQAIDIAIDKYEINYFYGVLGEGINLYYKEKYQEALDSIQKALPFIEKNELVVVHDFIANGYLYEGKIHQHFGKKEKLLESLSKLDDFLTKTKFASLESRQGYEILINHFKKNERKDKELLYTQKLIRYDSLLYQNFKALTYKIIKEYDTPILLKEEKKLIQSLQKEKRKTNYSLLASVFIGILILGILVFTYLKQRSYKKRYNKLIQKISQKSSKLDAVNNTSDIGISTDIVNSIMEQLMEFEKNKGYLLSNITVGKIAQNFGTNSKYISKVVNYNKKKSFVSYINELRINYAAEELKKNHKLRNYTLAALAREFGFNTSESFSKSFYKAYGITPSFYINKLEKQ